MVKSGVRTLYNILFSVCFALSSPYYFVRMRRRGNWQKGFAERFGRYDTKLKQSITNRDVLWMHAVSVGEVNIALKLANALRALEPDLRCVLTTTTTTGFALAHKTAPRWIEVMYTPLDYWPIMRRASRTYS